MSKLALSMEGFQPFFQLFIKKVLCISQNQIFHLKKLRKKYRLEKKEEKNTASFEREIFNKKRC